MSVRPSTLVMITLTVSTPMDLTRVLVDWDSPETDRLAKVWVYVRATCQLALLLEPLTNCRNHVKLF